MQAYEFVNELFMKVLIKYFLATTFIFLATTIN